MPTITIRREIVCLCDCCWGKGEVWANGLLVRCWFCSGTGQIVRHINEVKHVNLRQLANDGTDAADMSSAE